MNDKIAISTSLLNAVLGYLGERPYKEVFQLIEAIQKEAKQSVDPNSPSQ